MARLRFSKWHGTGNDFMVVDDRGATFPSTDLKLVQRSCDRHFGIGSDGLILIQSPRTESTAYHMEFFNPDGSQSFCGNGSRCAFAFWSSLHDRRASAQGRPQETLRFTAIDGEHTAAWADDLVTIGMRDVRVIKRINDTMDFIQTGSPHLLCWVKDPGTIDLMPEAHKHRYSPRFAQEGVNVNFIRWKDGRVEMRTYERGVEGETLSCGTGVTAAALSAMWRGLVSGVCEVRTRGGDLRVQAKAAASGGFQEVTLSGPVQEVFTGEVEISSRMKRSRILIALLFVFLLLGAFFAWRIYHSVFGPGPRSGDPDRILLIPTGSTFDQVVDSLKASGLVADERTFRLLAERKKYPGKVKPGRYRIVDGTSLNELVNKLRGGEQDAVRITFTNIRTLPQLAGQVARYLEADSIQLIEAMNNQATVERLGFRSETMISLFVPNTYEFWWTTKPGDFLERMAKEYKRFWTEDRRTKTEKAGLSQSEVSTLASIVQAETAKPDEAPIIAGVYLNRLRIGMPLQADPTLKFALGMDSVSRILTADKQVDSPYNTYTHTGLPPGPINMPEPRYIDAVLNAEKHDFLYFCARETLDGYSNFAKTYEQHLVNARRYQRALNKRGIYR